MWKRWLNEVMRYLILTLGAFIGAFSVILFLAPFEIAPTGVSGLAVILNKLISTPIGLMTFLMNIPIQFLALRMLPDGLGVVLRTVFVIAVYSAAIDLLTPLTTQLSLSDDRLLNSIFGGVTAGIAAGIIYRVGSTLGGTSTLALILQRRTGTPMSTTYLYTDTLVIVIAGFVFGLEGALYATIVLFISGLATDYVMEGPSIIRTAVVITDKPQEVADAIIQRLGRGVTAWQGQGMYTGQMRWVLYVTVARSQVPDLRRIIMQVDTSAFLVIGQGHAAYGHGFKRIEVN